MFFAMDPIGVLPMFVALTHGMTKAQKDRIIRQSLITAAVLAAFFILAGQVIFKLLGITIGDFMVAGGAILFCLSIRDLTSRHDKTPIGAMDDIGAVPIGTPLIVGPAVLTMSLILMTQHGTPATLWAVMLNIAIVGVLFVFADVFIRILGPSGSRTLSKVLSLLLAAIGVMMIRRGIIELISSVN